MGGKARKKPSQPSAQPAGAPLPPPTVHEATRLVGGRVKKGKIISQAQAEILRKQDGDVVVCGPQHAANMALARDIEQNANGRWKRCAPHRNAGPNFLAALSARSQTAGRAFS